MSGGGGDSFRIFSLMALQLLHLEEIGTKIFVCKNIASGARSNGVVSFSDIR